MKNMGKSLSPLQRDILAVLEEWPTFELAESAAAGSVKDWALPRDIIRRLGRPKTRSTQATISRALLQLHKKGLVARASGELADVGKSFHYLRISNPENAGAGNSGPFWAPLDAIPNTQDSKPRKRKRQLKRPRCRAHQGRQPDSRVFSRCF
jgi:hypothetical protein